MKKNCSTIAPNRRDFLKKSAAGIFGFTILPAYLTSLRAADNPKLPPSNRINLACIGAGGRAKTVIRGLATGGTALPVAYADVDFGHARAKGAEAGIKKFNPKAKRYHDFRVMLEEMGDDIDAVSICTPDHTHFAATILAMSMGKHVYTEKPLTHTFLESEILMRAEQKYGVVTQMGNQGHTSTGAEQFKQMVEHGIIRDIVKMEAWKGSSLWFMKANERFAGYPKAEPIPESLHSWDLWCGPKERHPFSSKYHPFNWRAFYAYGGGMLGDWGAHIIDFAHHYLDLGLPTKISPVRLYDHNDIMFPRSSHIKFLFPERGAGLPEFELDWKAGNDLTRPVAEDKYGDPQKDGSVKVPNLGGAGSFMLRDQGDYLIERGHHHEPSHVYPRTKMVEFGNKMRAAAPPHNHQQNFIAACKGEAEANSPFSWAGLLTQTLTLGVIAERLNVDLTFDRESKRFIGNDDANFWLKGPRPSQEWSEYYMMA
ncbi:Gfo/Idh/MocA family oxidoreductase [Coraliomargarita sp. W4R53]